MAVPTQTAMFNVHSDAHACTSAKVPLNPIDYDTDHSDTVSEAEVVCMWHVWSHEVSHSELYLQVVTLLI